MWFFLLLITHTHTYTVWFYFCSKSKSLLWALCLKENTWKLAAKPSLSRNSTLSTPTPRKRTGHQDLAKYVFFFWKQCKLRRFLRSEIGKKSEWIWGNFRNIWEEETRRTIWQGFKRDQEREWNVESDGIPLWLFSKSHIIHCCRAQYMCLSEKKNAAHLTWGWAAGGWWRWLGKWPWASS